MSRSRLLGKKIKYSVCESCLDVFEVNYSKEDRLSLILCQPCREEDADYKTGKGHQPSKIGGTEPRELPEPTTALPGTAEKLQVLVKRARAGQILHHPDDPKTFERGSMFELSEWLNSESTE